MAVDIKEVNRIATLAKLEFNAEEKEEITADMNRMLGFIEQLKEVNTDDIEPLIYMLEEEAILRNDVIKQTISQKEALKNAPESDSDFIRVPKVLG